MVSYINQLSDCPATLQYDDPANLDLALANPAALFEGRKYCYIGKSIEIESKSLDLCERIKRLFVFIVKCMLAPILWPIYSNAYCQMVSDSYLHLKGLKTISVYLQESSLKEYHNRQKEKQDTIASLSVQSNFEAATCQISDTYQRLVHTKHSFQNQLMGKVLWVPGEFGLHMPGVALIASHLSKKHRINGVFVCQTIEAFMSNLEKIATGGLDVRYALIVAGCSSGYFEKNYPQHKLSVCIEKKGNEIKIAVLDPDGFVINKGAILKPNLWDGIESRGEYSTLDLVLRAIHLVKTPSISMKLYYNLFGREKVYGCAVFALRDAFAFMKDPDFFKKISVSCNKIKLDANTSIEGIQTLPPAFMKGTQSVSLLNQYYTSQVDLEFETLSGKKKNLQNSLKKYQVFQNNKLENHYITWKVNDYLSKVKDALEKQTTHELQEEIMRCLIQA